MRFAYSSNNDGKRTMTLTSTAPIIERIEKTFSIREELRIEILRKGIHLLIAFVPAIAQFGQGLAMGLLSVGILVYTVCEGLRISGYQVPLISFVTASAARRRDAGRFVLGPVTLGLGALLSLLLYPNPAATLAIYALAFGDGLSSLVGKSIGSIRLPFTGGKSLEGSLTCLSAVFVASMILTGDVGRSLIVATAATLIEAVPTKDFDNILLPVLTGAIAVLVF
jgi:phytol kinase